MKNEKIERKREKGQCYYPFTTLVLQSSTMIFMIDSLLLRESWIRGCSDSRTIHIIRTIGAFRYKTQDSVPCPDGTLLCLENKLGDLYIVFPPIVTDSV